MLVAESLCWRLFSLCWRFSQCIKSVTNILNRSPTSQTYHQHIWSPTSVTNIDVTEKTFENPYKFVNMISKKNQKELDVLLKYAKANNVKQSFISKLEFTIDCLSDRKKFICIYFPSKNQVL